MNRFVFRLCVMIRQPGRGRRRLVHAGLLAMALGSLTMPAGARVAVARRATGARRAAGGRRVTAHRPVSARDRASTHAYLQASYEFDLAALHNAPQSRAATEALVTKLGAECPGALAGAPGEEPLLGLVRRSRARHGARARGEADRTSHQRGLLEGELTTLVLSTPYQPDRPLIAKLAAALTPLRWSDPRIALMIRSDLALTSALLEPAVPNVCADIHSWVASGYRRLSVATKEFAAQQAARFQGAAGADSVEGLLKRYEDAADRAIVRRTEALKGAELKDALISLRIGERARTVLGIAPEREEIPSLGTRVGGGRTRAGGRYTVRVGAPSGILHGPRCRHELTTEYASRSRSGASFSTGSGSTSCLPGAGPGQAPTVSCDGGLLKIESRVPLKTRSVRLLLSDGTSVRSPVIAIPPRLGGPARFYYQAVRGPSPYPVSLTELDGRGRALRVVRLPPVRHCHKTVVSPPALETIVHATAPGGTPFTITGFSFGFRRRHEFSLSGDARESGGLLSNEAEAKPALPAILGQIGLEANCSSPPFAIVYGWLKSPGARVLVQTPTGLVRLAEAKIPAALHTRGVVAYGAFTTLPTALIVRARNGHTLARVDLSHRAAEENEYCEGYAER